MLEGPLLNRIMDGGVRYYSPVVDDDVLFKDRQFAPSVTSIQNVANKGPYLRDWGINKFANAAEYKKWMTYAAFVGTIAHDFIDQLVRGYEVSISGPYVDDEGITHEISRPHILKPVQGFLIAFMKFWRQEGIIEVLGSETMMWSEEFAGTADLVAIKKFRKGTAIAMYDWKSRLGMPMTGDHPAWRDHQDQLTGYKDLWDASWPEMVPDDFEKSLDINLLYNVYLGEKGGFKKKARKYSPVHWNATVDFWYSRNVVNPREPVELPTTFKLEEEDVVSETED